MRKTSFNEYFYCNRSERRAIILLGCILFFYVGVLLITDSFQSTGNADKDKSVEEAKKTGESKKTSADGKALALDHTATFDPNTVDSLTLVSFGIKPWKVKNFLRYRAAGKIFRSVDDIGKTYGWKAEDIALLSPYIVIGEEYRKPQYSERRERTEHSEHASYERPAKSITQTRPIEQEKQSETIEQEESTAQPTAVISSPKAPTYRKSNKFTTLTVVDANTADTLLLQRIPGIGSKISNAIVRYREQLGGFYSVRQLSEIKIFSPELLEWFTVTNADSIRRININQASFQQVNSHPYFSYEQTKAILNHIRWHGPIQDEQTLQTVGRFTPKRMERLRPYIIYK